MSEFSKTMAFFAAAVAAVARAVIVQPRAAKFDVQSMQGQQLFDEFAIDAPKRLKITRIDSDLGQLQEFEVAEDKGLWTIPSKAGYPADATTQMAEAVEGLSGREILRVVTEEPGRHAEFGVLLPSGDIAIGQEGTGSRVQLVGADDKTLVDLVIGKVVRGSESQHYVRKATQDAVYVVEIDPAKFSTDFSKWIERDLLDLNPFDISRVNFDDYSASAELRMTNQGIQPVIVEDRRGKFDLQYSSTDSKWEPVRLERFVAAKKDYIEFALEPDQQLNEDSLRELKTALDDLTIVDVDRKPDGLSADLKAGKEFLTNQQTVESLVRRGFIPVGDGQGGAEILSGEGQLIVTLNDGVEYVLRYGDLQLDLASGEAEGETKADDAAESEEEKKDDAAVNRYLFVLARLNESAIEAPQYEQVPELPPEDAAAAGTPAAEEAAAEGEEAQADAKAKRDQIIAQRAAIEEANAQKKKEYEQKIADAKKRVDELNLRFGDWYYVVANDVFRKIHLGEKELVQAKPAPAEGAAAPAASEEPAGIPGLPDLGGAVLGNTAESAPPAAADPAAEETTSDEPAATEEAPVETPATDGPPEAPAEAPSGGEAAPAEAPVTEPVPVTEPAETPPPAPQP